MTNVNRYLAPTAEEVTQIRDDALRLRTCGLTGHSALFHGHTESLLMLLDLDQAALAFLGDPARATCPGCQAARGTDHEPDCWVQALVRQAITATAANGAGPA